MPAKPPPPNLDSFHKERSKLMDGFALVEARLVQAIARKGGLAKGGTLATRIKSLREQGATQHSAELEACFDRLQNLNALRTDLVHGTLGLIDHDGERFAIFSNARDAAKPVQSASRLTYKTIQAISRELTKCAALIEAA